MELTRILIVEDEEDIRELMAFHLSKQDMEIDIAEDGKKAYDKLLRNKYDLVVMDWMVPEVDGLDLLSWIRKKENKTHGLPVLMVTAKSDPSSIVQGLEAGADDYMVKPFDFNVLRARINNLLTRSKRIQGGDVTERGSSFLKMGRLSLNKDSHEVKLEDQVLDLTFSEFKMLEALLLNQGRVLSRKKITSFIQGEDVVVAGRTIDTHISSLRKKLGSYGEKIETIRGIGYRVSIE